MNNFLFHHIGYVVPSINMFKEKQLLLAQSKPLLEFTDKIQGAKVQFSYLNQNCFFEIIEPLEKKSHLSNFLKKNQNGGLHHLCYESKNFTRDINVMTKKLYRQITKTSKGFENRYVAFFIPRNSTSPLIEIISEPDEKYKVLPSLK